MNNVQLQQSLLDGAGLTGPKIDPSSPVWLQFVQAHRIEFVAFFACFGLMLLVFELVRRHEIKEKYSFLWFITGVSMVVLTLKRDWLTKLASFIGVYYPPTALFLVLSFFVIVILVHYSIVISKLLGQNQKLAQKLALLEAEVDQMKTGTDDDKAA